MHALALLDPSLCPCALSRASSRDIPPASANQLNSDVSPYAHIYSLSLLYAASPPIEVGPKDTLKLTFQIVDKETGKGVQPHQTFLRFYDEQTREEGIQPVRVTPGGKAKFELVRSMHSQFTRIKR
jgi:hypothetical protein